MEIKFNKVNFVCTDNATYIKKILSNINLSIIENTITGIVGNSESGKTTLLEMINGIITPTKGDIKISNSKIGMVFKDYKEQFFMDTVEKELKFSIKHFNNKNNITKHMIDSLIMVGLDESYLNRSINSLSSGEKKNLAIASMLCTNPKIILLDEPTLGLDNASINNLIKLLKMLKNRYNKTIIITSKDTDFIHRLADKVIVLNQGKIVLEGDKYDVFTQNIEQYGLCKPKIINFAQYVRDNKKIRLLYRDEINDLMKDIYRYVK